MVSKWCLVGCGSALIAGIVVGTIRANSLNNLQHARDQATIESHNRTISTLLKTQSKLDTVFITKYDTLKTIMRRWDTLRTIVDRVDTLVHIDTLRILIQAGDSMRQACTSTITACEVRFDNMKQLFTAESTQVAALSRELARAKVRSRLACTLGGGLTTRGFDTGVLCGIRIF